MRFKSRFDAKAGFADLWDYIREPRPYRWPFLALSLAIGVAVAPPSIIDLVADDPDESDLHFAEFDTLDVLFDRPTSITFAKTIDN